MDTNLLDKMFSRIGARLKVADRPARRASGVISLDVQADRQGEFFEIARQHSAEAEIAVLDVQPTDRHLLLLVREGKEKSKFLCGHDERHWFVAGIPEKAPVGTVRQAKEALKPAWKSSSNPGPLPRRKRAHPRFMETAGRRVSEHPLPWGPGVAERVVAERRRAERSQAPTAGPTLTEGLRLRSFRRLALLRFHRLAEAETFAVHLQDVTAVREPVQ